MDLRRRALKGGKTVSRKHAANEYAEGAGAVPASAASSQASSRNSSRAASSRAASRPPSEDEDEGNVSDETGFRWVSLLSCCFLFSFFFFVSVCAFLPIVDDVK